MTQAPQTPPGWYQQPDGRQRYWDGYRWTEQYAAGAPGPGPGMAPQRSSNKGCWIAAITVLVLVVAGVAAVGFLINRTTNEMFNTEHTVVYSITGTGTEVDIRYSEGSGSTSTVTDATLPWSKTITTKGRLTFLSLSGFQGGSGAGDLACKITVDGQVVEQSTATGAGSSVICTHMG